MQNRTRHQPDAERNAFDCTMCGRCCEGAGGIVVSGKDLSRLCEHLNVNAPEFEGRWGERRDGKLQIKTGADGYCIFFRARTGCGVHHAKPDICRAWPFFRGNLVDGESFSLAADFCPGIQRECGHDAFVRQGLDTLRREGLTGRGRSDEATALQVDDLLKNPDELD